MWILGIGCKVLREWGCWGLEEGDNKVWGLGMGCGVLKERECL